MTPRLLFGCCLALCLMGFSCKGQAPDTAAADQEGARDRPASRGDSLVITPVSHASAVLQWGETTLYIDPVGDPGAYTALGPADLILVTDLHGDHFSLETLQGLSTEKAKLIMPGAVAAQMPEAFAPQVDVLGNGEQKERFGITVTAIPMYNLREEAREFHVKGRGNGYVLEKGGMRIYFSGDTEDIPEMRALKNIDKAFICMNLPYTMTVEQAADAVLEFAPKEVFPYHYRGRPDVSDVGHFARLVAEGNPGIRVVQLDWYPDAPY